MDAHFDEERRRLHIRYHGFWSVDDTNWMHQRFSEIIRETSQHGRFTLLDDLSDFDVQSREVVELNRMMFVLVEGAPIVRNAMLVPSALLRRQLGRQATFDGDLAMFETYAAADSWLAEVEPST